MSSAREPAAEETAVQPPERGNSQADDDRVQPAVERDAVERADHPCRPQQRDRGQERPNQHLLQ